MNPRHHKDDFFIAEYTLGLLEPDDIAQAHALLGEDDAAVVCALQWEARLLELTDALTPLHPPAPLLGRIHATLGLPYDAAALARARPSATSAISATSARSAAPAAPATSATPATPAESAALASPAPAAPPSSSTASSAPSAASAETASRRPAGPASPPVSSAQSGMAMDFEPRLIRPDSASLSQSQAAGRESPAVSGRGLGTADGAQGSAAGANRVESSHAEPSRADYGHAGRHDVHRSGGDADRFQGDRARRGEAVRAEPSLAPEAPATAPSRVRTAPPDPTEAFRREAASRRPVRRAIWRSLWFWRALSAALAVLAAVLVLPKDTFRHDPALGASLQPVAAPAPKIVQVAVMQAPGLSSTPGWILTVDSRQNVVLAPQVDIVVPESESVYLWTYNEQSPHPRLLGAIDPTRSLTLPMDVTGEVTPGQIFEMTQEPNAAPPREPDGPILFIGRTVSLG